ncbi:MAG TPA: cytochrome c biogenesis protein [Acidisarcina sp.]
MKFYRSAWLIGTLALLVYGFRVAMYGAPTEATMGNIQRIFYCHFPAWIAMSLCFAANLIASIAYLSWRNSNSLRALKSDALALATAEMGVIFCLVGLVTGSLWARPVWGIWWTWDERLTSTLVLWLIYVSYLLLRNFAEGPQMRTLSAVLAIFGFLDIPIVYMSTRWWRTQHPAPVILGGPNSGLDPSMWSAVWWNLAAWVSWGAFVVVNRYRLERERQRVDEIAVLRALEPATEVNR